MRFVNPHIYYMKKRSALGKRILEQVAKLPFENSDKFVDEVINRTCRPAGYFPVVDAEQFRDFYAFCVLRLVLAAEENESDDLDNVLFDQPLVIGSLLTAYLLAYCIIACCNVFIAVGCGCRLSSVNSPATSQANRSQCIPSIQCIILEYSLLHQYASTTLHVAWDSCFSCDARKRWFGAVVLVSHHQEHNHVAACTCIESKVQVGKCTNPRQLNQALFRVCLQHCIYLCRSRSTKHAASVHCGIHDSASPTWQSNLLLERVQSGTDMLTFRQSPHGEVPLPTPPLPSCTLHKPCSILGGVSGLL